MKRMMARFSKITVSCLAALALGMEAHAASYTGAINWIEVWPNGNVAFSVAGAAPPCGLQQFVLNVSNPGTKNAYALLLTLKSQGKPVRVSSSSCGPAEGYNPNSSYALVEYVNFD
jgi:hypothetical protein